jgi:sulfur carrier protein
VGVEPVGVEPVGVEPAGVEPAGIEPAGIEPARIAECASRHHNWAMEDVLTLRLNGENRQFVAPDRGSLSVLGLLTELGLDMRKVAVERNEEIVPRSRYAETWLLSGDQLEIVHFIGGG